MNEKVFLDISIADSSPRRLTFELFTDIVPKTAENFRALCSEEKGISINGILLSYKGSIIHRVIKGFVMQGGDITTTMQYGTGGESIYGKRFEDENFLIKHNERGLLSMANFGPNTNGSQFFITFKELPELDSKYVAFGKVIENIDLLEDIEYISVDHNGYPLIEVKIIECGQL